MENLKKLIKKSGMKETEFCKKNNFEYSRLSSMFSRTFMGSGANIDNVERYLNALGYELNITEIQTGEVLGKKA